VDSVFVEGETECTSERARGQFSIFGAIEEMLATDSGGSAAIKKRVEDILRRRMEGACSNRGRLEGEKL
jgi:hypothetical protein